MRIEIINDSGQLRGLRECWQQLLSSREDMPLPLTHEWISAWWRNFAGGRQLNIFCVYDDNRLLAVAPFFRTKLAYRGVPATVLRLMANGHSPFCDLIMDGSLDAGQVSQVLGELLEASRENIMVFAKLSDSSQVYSALTKAGRVNGRRYGVRDSLVTPVLKIAGPWDDYFRSRSKKFRKSIKNKLNRLAKEPDVGIDRIKVTSADAPVLDEIVQVSKSSWKTRVKNDLGSNPAGKQFLFDLVDEFGPGGAVTIWVMRKAGVPVAFEFHLEFDSVVYPLRADFNEDYRKLSPGSVLEYTTLKTLFEEGRVSSYYSCADNYWYLNNWTDEMRRHYDVEVFNNGLKPFCLHALEYRAIPLLRNVRDKIRRQAD